MNIIKRAIRGVLRTAGFDLVPYPPPPSNAFCDLSPEETKTLAKVTPFTMTSPERVAALIEATRYISSTQIEGAIVECGVWRGGSTMAALLTLQSLGDIQREVYLYDTYEGMPPPTASDLSYDGVPAAKQLAESQPGTGVWCYASLEEVKANVLSTGYPPARVHFVRGKVEDTIPGTLPGAVAILRLDTDWYESTRHELINLFPLLHPRGVLIIDDYGHWAGARKAVDEFFSDRREQFYFHRIDNTGRLIMRLGS